jgi:hypothetical protein
LALSNPETTLKSEVAEVIAKAKEHIVDKAP